MSIQGEGFLYFSEDAYSFNTENPFALDNYWPPRVDLSATIINHILSRTFFDYMFAYFVVLFIVMLVVILTMYILVRVMTGSKLAAFCAAVIFGLSYAANANMLASGGYQYFSQRVVLVAPLFIAFLLLYKYLHSRFLGYYILSLILYLLILIFGSYATDFLPAIILYPLVFVIFNIKTDWSFFIQTIWIPLPFMIGNYFIVRNAGTLIHNTPAQTHFLINFFQKILDFSDTIPKFLQQMAVLTLPFLLDSRLFQLNIGQQLILAEILSVIIYAAAFIFLWKTKPSWRIITIFFLGGFIAILYLNLFLNPEQSLNTLESSRYFYYPFLMGAMFWGLFFASTFLYKRGILRVVFISILFLWLSYNIFSIERVFKEEGWRNTANKDMLAKIKEWSPVLKERPYFIYFPGSFNTLGPGGLWFARTFYAHPKTQLDFNEPDLPTLAKQNILSEDIFVFRFDHQTHKVSDETEKWRTKLEKLENEK